MGRAILPTRYQPPILEMIAMFSTLSVRSRLAIAASSLPVFLGVLAFPAIAQTAPPMSEPEAADVLPEPTAPVVEGEMSEEPAEALTESAEGMMTVCQFDPSSGALNVLGMRTALTVTESGGNTAFVLDRFPAFVTSPDNTTQRADVSEVRSLTLYDTPLAEARQLMIDQPFYYAELLEVDEVDEGFSFSEVNDTLSCETTALTPPTDSTPPTSPTPPTSTPAPAPLSDLPNGNYRLVSADFPNRVVTDEELLEAGGAIFLFRKFGDNVTGTYGFIDHEGGSCISGTLEGNVVTGESVSDGDTVRSGMFLTLGEEQADGRYEGSTLNLAEFSRINAGTRLPVESCS